VAEKAMLLKDNAEEAETAVRGATEALGALKESLMAASERFAQAEAAVVAQSAVVGRAEEDLLAAIQEASPASLADSLAPPRRQPGCWQPPWGSAHQ